MKQTLEVPKAYFPALTGVRAVAAFLVFFFHFNPFTWKGHPGTNVVTKLLGAIIGQWHIGVSVFFVLSGFLITFRYIDRVEISAKWAKKYMLNRFARIYPVYFLLTVITLVVMCMRHTDASYEWTKSSSNIERVVMAISSLTLTRGFFHSIYLLGVPTAWSLTVEECFYVSAPFLLLILRRRPTLLWVFGIVILAFGILSTLISTHFRFYGEYMRPFSFMLTFTYFGRATEFLIGIGFALWLKKQGSLPVRRGTTLVGLCLISLFLTMMVYTAWGNKPTDIWPLPLSTIMINNFLLPFGIVVLFNGLIRESSLLRKILENRVSNLLGKSSYAFYLIHLGLFADLLIDAVGLHVWLLFLIFNVLAIVIYKFIEHPLHTYLIHK